MAVTDSSRWDIDALKAMVDMKGTANEAVLAANHERARAHAGTFTVDRREGYARAGRGRVLGTRSRGML